MRLLIWEANSCEASRNSLSSTRTKPETDGQRRGFSGSMLIMQPGLKRVFEILQIVSRSPGDIIQRQIFSSLYTTGYAIIAKESGLLYLTISMMLVSFLRLKASVRRRI